MLKNRVFLVNTLLQWLLAYMSSASGGLRPTPTRSLPLDPAGRLLPPVPLFCPSPKQISGYVPGHGLSTVIASCNLFVHRQRKRGRGRGSVHVPQIRQTKIPGSYRVKFGHFSGKYHAEIGIFYFSGKFVKFGHFVNFSHVYFRGKYFPPPKVD